jgi:hypothetical protein
VITPGSPWSRVERAGLAIGIAVAIALTIPLRGYVTDDTFIHLQYAHHLAHGQGLVFNVGERIYGCTSPLWVALIADGILLGLDGLLVARALGMLATLASIVFFMQLMRRTVRVPAIRAVATVAWAGHAWMLRWSMSGMETPLAVALVIAGFVAYTEGKQWGARPARTGALWGLAALARPEAVFLLMAWAVLLLIDAESRNGLRRLVFGVVPPAVIYGGWLLFARLYFGTFWPQTLSAKTAGAEGLAFHVDNLLRQGRIVAATDGLLVVLLVIAMGFRGPRVLTPGVPARRLLPWAWVLGLPALYAARSVPVISRYLLPLLPVVAWMAWRAAAQWWAGEAPNRARERRAIGLAAAVAALVLIQNLFVYRSTVVPHVRSFSAGMRESLIPWGRWFARHTPPEAVIAVPDIGAIGYYSQRRVVDLAGLVTPEMVPVLRREPQEDAVANLSFASFARPDFLVDRASVANDLLARSPYAPALVPLGSAAVPNLGIARPGRAFYTFYRVDWAAYDSLRARRRSPPAP